MPYVLYQYDKVHLVIVVEMVSVGEMEWTVEELAWVSWSVWVRWTVEELAWVSWFVSEMTCY